MLSTLIDQAGGLTGDAFLGRALIIRQGPDLTLASESVNLQEIISRDSDIKLNNEDLIKIQSIHDLREMYTVRIEGEIQIPGGYPYVENMTVEDLIFMAKGFKKSAARANVEITRQKVIYSQESWPIPNMEKINSFSEILNFKINSDLTLDPEASDIKLLPFDLITIRRNPSYTVQEMVEIEGEVKYPGKYGLRSKTETIFDIVNRSGGLKEDAYTEGAMLIRRSEYLKEDGELTNYRGQIKRTKVLTILENDTAAYAAAEARFDLPEAIGIELTKILSDPNSESNMTLKDGDIISIPRKLSTVRVRGEVLNPGKVKHLDKLNFKQYISRSGGFSSMAKKSKSYIIYANGSSKQTSNFLGMHFYPKVLPGAEIVVPQKPISTKTSVAEIVSLASALASLTLIINSLVQ